MITYVNTVLVGKGTPTVVSSKPTVSDAGKYVILNVSDNSTDPQYLTEETISDATKIKVGLVTSAKVKDIKGNTVPVIKWSNVIDRNSIKSFNTTAYKADSEDKVTLDFTGATSSIAELAKGNRRVIVRLTFKDTPTRYRKWTDSYEYVTAVGDTAATIAEGLANVIKKEWKRSRVEASASAGVLTITALPYDDDDSVDTINVAAKVRFSANAYYTDPQAAGFASKNKYSISGLTIKRTPGDYYTASAKLVRDREAQAMGYEGILNRGCCTWPIIKPAMSTDLDAHYDSLTLEFENLYRAADDIFRRTKQTLEIYDINMDGTGIAAALDAFVNPEA